MGVDLSEADLKKYENHYKALCFVVQGCGRAPNNNQFAIAVAAIQYMQTSTVGKRVLCNMPAGLGKSRVTSAFVYLAT